MQRQLVAELAARMRLGAAQRLAAGLRRRQVDAQRLARRASSSRSAARAGPLRPRWVNSRSSTKRAAACGRCRSPMATSSDTPASAANGAHAAASKVSGTSAGRGSTTRWPNWRAEPVAQVGGADLRNRQAAGGHHQLRARAPGRARCRARSPPAPWRTAAHAAGLPALHRAGAALGQQHADDLLGRVVAEQLAAVLFVEGDAVALHQRDEVALACSAPAPSGRSAGSRTGSSPGRRRGW